MKQMGWKEGDGLGRNKDGIEECIQIRRREELIGLGFKRTDGQDKDTDWWTQIYEKGLVKNTKGLGGMNFIQGKALNSVGVLAKKDDDLTSDISEEEEPVKFTQYKPKKKQVSARDKLKMKLKGEYMMFKKGEVLKSEFDKPEKENSKKIEEEDTNEHQIIEEQNEEEIVSEEEEVVSEEEEVVSEEEESSNEKIEQICQNEMKRKNILPNQEYVKKNFIKFFDCSSEYSNKEKKIFKEFVGLVSKYN